MKSSQRKANQLKTATTTMASPVLPIYSSPDSASVNSVQRVVEPYTIIPSRPRVDVIPYTVKLGDTVIGIAASFGLNPETILWSNYNVLADNPHSLQPGQVLEILPVNGTYHKWSAGEDLQKVADFYHADPMDIIEWPGNPFDIYETNLNLDLAKQQMFQQNLHQDNFEHNVRSNL